MSTAIILASVAVAGAAITAAEAEIEGLDRAIGDGDHYHNVKRGVDTLAAMAGGLEGQPADAVLKAMGMKLLSTIGGASGPLISSFFLAAAKVEGVNGDWDNRLIARLVAEGVAAIRQRGKGSLGEKTMLDVLIPVAERLSALAEAGAAGPVIRAEVAAVAEAGMRATRDIRATRGRAAFLGERAIGHIDPGAMSAHIIIGAICGRAG